MKNLFDQETQVGLFDEEDDKVLKSLKALQLKYFSTSDGVTKKQIKNLIDKIEHDLIEASVKTSLENLKAQKLNIKAIPGIGLLKEDVKRLEKINSKENQIFAVLDELKKTGTKPFFLWHLHFAEVFENKGGFDVVIANPPYDVLNKTEGHKISDEELLAIRNYPLYQPALGGKLNLFRLFIALGISINKNTGTVTMIVPYAYMGDRTSKGIRDFCLENTQLIFIEAFPERDNEKVRFFESVKMSTCIFSLTNSSSTNNFRVRTHYAREIFDDVPTVWLNKFDVYLLDPTNHSIPLINQPEFEILKKIVDPKISFPLSNIGRCYEGEINLTFHKKYLSTDNQYSKMIKGAQVNRYQINRNMSQGVIEYVKESEYLKANGGEKASHHLSQRIVMQGITGVNEKTRLKMTFLPQNIYCGNSVNYVLLKNGDYDPKFILGVLNSKLINWLFKKFSTNSNVNGYEVDGLPIAIANNDERGKITDVVNKLLNLKSMDNYDENIENKMLENQYEKEINSKVCKIYHLNDDEIELINNFHD